MLSKLAVSIVSGENICAVDKTSEITHFLSLVFGNECGVLFYWRGIETSDAKIKPIGAKKALAYDRQNIQQIATQLVTYAAEYDHTYYHSALYIGAGKAKEVNTLPSRFIVIDDYIGDLEPSFAVRTSAASIQAYFKLDEPINAAVRKELTRAIVADKLRGDAPIDAGHPMRFPGSVNSKRKYSAPFVARLEAPAAPRIYTVAELYLLVGVSSYPTSVTAPLETTPDGLSGHSSDDLIGVAVGELINWPRVAELVDLGLLQSTSVKNAIKHQYIAPIMQQRTPINKQTGKFDRSVARMQLFKSLCRQGFPPNAVAGFIFYLADFGHSARVGKERLRKDIEAIAQKHLRPEDDKFYKKGTNAYTGVTLRTEEMILGTGKRKNAAKKDTITVSGTKYKLTPGAVEQKGRPKSHITAEVLYEHLVASITEGVRLNASQVALGEQLGTSAATIRRLEQQLSAAGRIRRDVDGRTSYVDVLDIEPRQKVHAAIVDTAAESQVPSRKAYFEPVALPKLPTPVVAYSAKEQARAARMAETRAAVAALEERQAARRAAGKEKPTQPAGQQVEEEKAAADKILVSSLDNLADIGFREWQEERRAQRYAV